MKFISSLKIVALALAVAGAEAAVMSNVLQSRECLPDGAECSSKNNKGQCCSKYCLSMPGEDGTCQPMPPPPPPTLKARHYGCLAEGTICDLYGTRGTCCSGNCEQLAGDETGTCGQS